MARRNAGSAGKITNRQIGVFAAYVSRHCGSAQGRWAAADSVYGVGEIETAMLWAGKGYVLGVNGSHLCHSWGDKPAVGGTAEKIAQALPASAWARLSAGEGIRGLGLHDLGTVFRTG